MKVKYGIGKAKLRYRDPVVVIGVFDGVHKGHQRLLKAAVSKARSIGRKCLALTFWPHPVHILRPHLKQPLIVSLEHRIRLIEECGVDRVFVIRFTKQFSHLTPEKFVKRYLVDKIRPSYVFVGDDFRFGQDRAGDLKVFDELAKQHGFRVRSVGLVKGRQKKIGSSQIRDLIRKGDVRKAGRLLGRPVSVLGRVVRGDSRGKALGFPTANIRIRNELVPERGVYAVKAVVGRKHIKGMANIGCRPSFKKSDKGEILEVHLFGFRGKLYGKEILVEFYKRMRGEKKFRSEERLVEQLKKDKEAVLQVLP